MQAHQGCLRLSSHTHVGRAIALQIELECAQHERELLGNLLLFVLAHLIHAVTLALHTSSTLPRTSTLTHRHTATTHHLLFSLDQYMAP